MGGDLNRRNQDTGQLLPCQWDVTFSTRTQKPPHACYTEAQSLVVEAKTRSSMQSTPPTSPKRSPSEYDAALKKLLETAHDGFLALIAPDVTFEASLPTELPATTRQADLVWAVTFDAGRQEATPDPSSESVGAARHRGLLHIEL